MFEASLPALPVEHRSCDELAVVLEAEELTPGFYPDVEINGISIYPVQVVSVEKRLRLVHVVWPQIFSSVGENHLRVRVWPEGFKSERCNLRSLAVLSPLGGS